jgi:hypothetical protein
MLENLQNTSQKSHSWVKNPPVCWPWFTFSWVRSLKSHHEHREYLHHCNGRQAGTGWTWLSLIAHDVLNQFKVKKLLGSHPNVWLLIQLLIGQEADSRCMLMHNATRMDLFINQGRDERYKDHKDKLMAIVKRFHDLSPYLYRQTLAKLLIDK